MAPRQRHIYCGWAGKGPDTKPLASSGQVLVQVHSKEVVVLWVKGAL